MTDHLPPPPPDPNDTFIHCWQQLLTGSPTEALIQLNELYLTVCPDKKHNEVYQTICTNHINSFDWKIRLIGLCRAVGGIRRVPTARSAVYIMLMTAHDITVLHDEDHANKHILKHHIIDLLDLSMIDIDHMDNHVKAYVKLVARLYEKFQIFNQIHVDFSLIERFMTQLIDMKLWTSVTRFILKFLNSLDDISLCKLVEYMCESEAPPEEIKQLFLSLNEAYSSSQSDSTELSQPVRSSIPCPYITIVTPTVDDALKLSIRAMLEERVMAYVNDNKDCNVKNVLSVVVDLVKEFNLGQELFSETKHKLQTCRIQGLVKSNKWHLAEQVAYTIPLKKDMYEYMKQENFHIQAKALYEKWNLQKYAVLPVREEDICAQHEFIEANYLTLPRNLLQPDRIVFVDTLESLFRAENVILRQGVNKRPDGITQWVGVDAEWRAVMGTTSRTYHAGSPCKSESGASILQISTVGVVFIFDLHHLGDRSGPDGSLCDESVRILGEIFSRPDVVKVGWDFSKNDVSKLMSSGGSAAYLRKAFVTINSLLHLHRMYDAAVSSRNNSTKREDDNSNGVETNSESKVDTRAMPTKQKKSSSKGMTPESYVGMTSSLSSCCEEYLGRPLRKDEQVSNWDSRPLDINQLHYAALDAHCLLGAMDAISVQMNFSSFCGALDGYIHSPVDYRKYSGGSDAWKIFMPQRSSHNSSS